MTAVRNRIKFPGAVAASAMGFGLLMTSSLCLAQTAEPAPSTTQAPLTPAEQEARVRFTRALALAEDGDLEAALEELKRSYALAPSYRILYNVGLVYQLLKDSARALDAFERYIAEGGAEVPAGRVAEVMGRMDRLKERVGFLELRSTPEGAEVAVDDLAMGRTPLPKKLRVNSGRRRITFTVVGRPPVTRIVELAGGDTQSISVDLTLTPTPAAVETHRSIVPWVSWGATALIAGAAATTGILSLNRTSKYDELQNQFGVTRAELSDARSQAQTLGLVTDILLGAAVVGAGVSVYFTIKPPGGRDKKPPKVAISTTGTMASMLYRF